MRNAAIDEREPPRCRRRGEPTVGRDLELGRIGLGHAARDDDLAARDRQRVHHRLRSRFPQPVAHLVVERLDLPDLVDVGVVAQAVEELRAVRLEVDRHELVVLDEHGGIGTAEHRMEVVASDAFPCTRERSEWAEVGERLRVAGGLGEQVVPVAVGVHDALRLAHGRRSYRAGTIFATAR